MFWVYILQSVKNNSYYVGSCADVHTRVTQHNLGLVKSTKRGLSWLLVYKEGFDNLKLARKRESQIKSWKKRSAIEKLLKTFQKF